MFPQHRGQEGILSRLVIRSILARHPWVCCWGFSCLLTVRSCSSKGWGPCLAAFVLGAGGDLLCLHWSHTIILLLPHSILAKALLLIDQTSVSEGFQYKARGVTGSLGSRESLYERKMCQNWYPGMVFKDKAVWPKFFHVVVGLAAMNSVWSVWWGYDLHTSKSVIEWTLL